jgi:hypothetical protein
MTLPELEAAVMMLRRHGVSKYTDVAGGGFEVEFFAPVAVDADSAIERTGEDDLCKCGHAMYEHTAGLCIKEGCDPTKCAPEVR